MSTKIYNGLRIPKERLESWTEWFHDSCIDHVAEVCAKLLPNIQYEEVVNRCRERDESRDGAMQYLNNNPGR